MTNAERMKACFIVTEGMWSSLALKRGMVTNLMVVQQEGVGWLCWHSGGVAMLAQWWGGYVGTVVGWLCWHSGGVAMLAQCRGGYVGTMVGWLCWHSGGVAMLAQAILAQCWGGYVGTMVGWLCWHSGGVAMLAQWWGGYVGTVLGWLCWHSVKDMGVLVLERNPKSFISACWFCSSASTCRHFAVSECVVWLCRGCRFRPFSAASPSRRRKEENVCWHARVCACTQKTF